MALSLAGPTSKLLSESRILDPQSQPKKARKELGGEWQPLEEFEILEKWIGKA